MRSIHLTTCAFAFAAALSTPAFAQGTATDSTTTATPTTSTATGTTDTRVRHDTDRGFDWGWLGLLGLAGLAGLRRQPDVRRVEPTRTSAQH